METELQKQLSALGMAPCVYYSDEFCRIEEYYPYEGVNLNELITRSGDVARLLKKLHGLNLGMENQEAKIRKDLLNPKLEESVMSVVNR